MQPWVGHVFERKFTCQDLWSSQSCLCQQDLCKIGLRLKTIQSEGENLSDVFKVEEFSLCRLALS